MIHASNILKYGSSFKGMQHPTKKSTFVTKEMGAL